MSPRTEPAASAPTRRRAHTRARLVESAADVFAEKALRRVTVDDLVQAAGFSRGAFYSNFTSIEELFFEVYADQADRMIAAVAEEISAVPAEDFTFDSVGRVFEALRPYGRRWFLIHSEFTLLAVRDEEARHRYAAYGDRFRDAIGALVARVLSLLEREPVVDVDELGDVMVGLYLHTLGNAHLGTDHLDPGRMVTDVLPHLVLGLSRPRTGGEPPS